MDVVRTIICKQGGYCNSDVGNIIVAGFRGEDNG